MNKQQNMMVGACFKNAQRQNPKHCFQHEHKIKTKRKIKIKMKTCYGRCNAEVRKNTKGN